MTSLWFDPHPHSSQPPGTGNAWADETVGAAAEAANANVAIATATASRRLACGREFLLVAVLFCMIRVLSRGLLPQRKPGRS